MEAKERRICHDLKTDRIDIGKPLPGIARLLPVGFYLLSLATVGLCLLFAYEMKKANFEKLAAEQEKTEQEAVSAKLKKESTELEAQAKKAEEVKKYVNSSQPVQELLMAINRSVRTGITMSDLTLARERDDASKLGFSVKFSGGGQQQKEDTLAKISALGYRPYQAEERRGKAGEFDYRALLLRTEKPVSFKAATN